MSYFVSIVSSHHPQSFSQDADGRDMWTMNFTAEAQAPVRLLVRQIGRYLIDPPVTDPPTEAVPESIIYYGRNAEVPSGIGPFVTIIDTGGSGDMIPHTGPRIESCGFQIVVRGKDVAAVEILSTNIWNALCDLHGVELADVI